MKKTSCASGSKNRQEIPLPVITDPGDGLQFQVDRNKRTAPKAEVLTTVRLEIRFFLEIAITDPYSSS